MAHLEPGYTDDDYIRKVKQAADGCGLKFGALAVDRAHIYEEDIAKREENRTRAKRWMDIAHMLGAHQVRIDSGGPAEFTDEIFQIVVDGYGDIMDYGRERGLEIVVENHWGPTIYAHNVARLLEAVPGLGLLLDTDNWAPGEAEKGAESCARYTRHTHIKRWPGQPEKDAEAIRCAELTMEALWAGGYRGPWGIESIALEGEEEAGVLETRSYIQDWIGARMER